MITELLKSGKQFSKHFILSAIVENHVVDGSWTLIIAVRIVQSRWTQKTPAVSIVWVPIKYAMDFYISLVHGFLIILIRVSRVENINKTGRCNN
jgi:hypothetical protein